jgi:hypothetical protein
MANLVRLVLEVRRAATSEGDGNTYVQSEALNPGQSCLTDSAECCRASPRRQPGQEAPPIPRDDARHAPGGRKRSGRPTGPRFAAKDDVADVIEALAVARRWIDDAIAMVQTLADENQELHLSWVDSSVDTWTLGAWGGSPSRSPTRMLPLVEVPWSHDERHRGTVRPALHKR